MRSYLAKHQPAAVWDAEDIRRHAGEAWRRYGVLCIRVDDLANDWERQFAQALGEKIFGKRTEW